MARLDLRLAMIVAGGFALASCGSDASSDDATADLSQPTVRVQLADASRALATQLEVAHPATMMAVATSDHSAAEAAISGAVLNEHDPVYVVQMTGGTFKALHHPQGQDFPTGTVLTVTYDAKTMRITDVGFDTVAPDLHAIDANVVDLMAP
jgi:hypothetical protein